MQYVGVLLLLFNKREILVSLETWWRVRFYFPVNLQAFCFKAFVESSFVSSLFSLLWILNYEQSCYFSLATLELLIYCLFVCSRSDLMQPMIGGVQWECVLMLVHGKNLNNCITGCCRCWFFGHVHFHLYSSTLQCAFCKYLLSMM